MIKSEQELRDILHSMFPLEDVDGSPSAESDGEISYVSGRPAPRLRAVRTWQLVAACAVVVVAISVFAVSLVTSGHKNRGADANTAGFENHRWRIVQVQKDSDGALTLPADLDPHLIFGAHNEFGGYDTVNSFGGKYVRDGAGFRVLSPLLSTAAGRPGAGGTTPAIYAMLQAIDQVSSGDPVRAETTSDTLTLTTGTYTLICAVQP